MKSFNLVCVIKQNLLEFKASWKGVRDMKSTPKSVKAPRTEKKSWLRWDFSALLPRFQELVGQLRVDCSAGDQNSTLG